MAGKGGARQGAGRPPIWDTEQIAAKVSQIQSVWWTQIEKMMTSKNPGERKFALSEVNKLQVKAMPQKLAGDKENPLVFSLAGLFNAAVDEK